MKRIIQLLWFGLLSGAGLAQYPAVSSPDGRMRMELGGNAAGAVSYRLQVDKKIIIDWSALGLVTDADGERKTAGMRVGKTGSMAVGKIGGMRVGKTGVMVVGKPRIMVVGKPRLHSERFAWPLGENDTIDNTYNALSVGIGELGLDIRMYNGSAAFRYRVSKAVGIRRELTGFNLKGSFTVYQYNQESVFTPVGIDTMRKTCDLPATLTDGHSWLSIGEAVNDDYTKAELAAGDGGGVDLARDGSGGLRLVYPRDSLVKLDGPGVTPWRTISVAGSAVGLHDYSELNLKLAPAAADLSRIRPGKLIRSALTTRDGLDCIEFAAKHHFQYVLFDAGWYGAEFRSISDPTVAIAAIDMPAVIQRGKEKGIGIILYVNYVGLRARLDTLLPLYKRWGVSGLKFGFVDGLTQNGIRWLAGAIRKVNDYGFILDIHDNYKPTGLSRTYPALLTQEGVRGDENSPDAFHTTVLPFTRFLAGPADFTFCYPNSRDKFTRNLKVSKAQQLALTVVYFSPLQSIFWYGRPDDYTDEGEIEFFGYVPTVWNESRYLAGEPGSCVSVARRKGDSWFIGNVAGPDGWEGSIRMDFLKPGRVYEATIYEDDGNQGIKKRAVRLRKGDMLPVHIAAAGGQALILR
jgi:alpha-glucosidase